MSLVIATSQNLFSEQEPTVDVKGLSEMENGDERLAGKQFGMVVGSETVGRGKCVEDLLHKLIPHPQGHQGNDDDLRIISVFDSESTGKTALARSVYGTPVLRRWFSVRAWVRVQDKFSVKDVLVRLLRQISTREMNDVDLANEIELSWRLQAYITDHRYLVVLDNINSIDLMWKLLRFLTDSSNGSRVIITTRNDNFRCFTCPWGDLVTFGGLTKEDRERLLLLCSNDYKLDKQDYTAPLCLTQTICSLSPAGIRLLGGLLSVTQENEEFEAMIGSLPEDPPLVDIVSLCYGKLSLQLQKCIMYVCQFPREYEIPIRRLLRLWLAESLVPATGKGIQGNSSIRYAKECFLELVRRNMVLLVSRGKGGEFAKTCLMPGFIYDFLVQKALETGFFSYSNDSSANTPNKELKFAAPRIVVDKHSRGSFEVQEQCNRTWYDIKEIRSYMSFNSEKIRMQKRELDIFLNPGGEKSSLEVLDLEGVYKPVLPKNIGNILLNLRYLGLRWTILHELPESVGALPCLETLDVKHTNIKKVPRSIWTKKSLRHLYLNEVSFDGKSIPRKRTLSRSNELPSSLHTLCGLHIEGKGPMLDLLSKLTFIRKLSLTCRFTVAKEVMHRIKGLVTLQSLKLKSKDLLSQPSIVHLEDMNRLLSLSNLYLFGDLQGNNLSFLPKNLKSLTLSMSFLTGDIMEDLGKLECLTDLRLYAFSFDGETLTCAGESFPRLRILKLWKLANLKCLKVMEKAMSCLEELEIRDCQKLEKIEGLGSRKELKEVSLSAVKEELARSLEGNLSWSIIITTKLIASKTPTEVN